MQELNRMPSPFYLSVLKSVSINDGARKKKIIGGASSNEKIKLHRNNYRLPSHKLRQKSYNHINYAEKVDKQYKMLPHFFKKIVIVLHKLIHT